MLLIRDISPRVVQRRRLIFLFFFLLIFSTGFVSMLKMSLAQPMTPVAIVTLTLFAILFAQLSFGVTLALFGFRILRTGGDPLRVTNTISETEETGVLPSTAIIMPIYNEEISRVVTGIAEMFQSLESTGHGLSFDFFLLSDSDDPNVWIEEEKSWLEVCKQVNGFGRIFYRKRRVRLNHKSGNVADFCRRWGANYRYMIVLDADSIMAGNTFVRLVELMETNRSIGIIQTAPKLVLGSTLFRRVQQFASAVYGPLFMAGSQYWHLGGGNYWGHNAIIRIKLFMEHCALPELPRVGALGGRILSHDTIEAAFMRRAGYGVWFAYDLEGSYEEGPPNLLASLKRDRRWCHGNMQHLLVLLRPGLCISSRIHILLGILSYASAPLWFAFMLLTFFTDWSLSMKTPPQVSPNLISPAHGAGLFAYIVALLLLPKVLGAVWFLTNRDSARTCGGPLKLVASVILETFFSALLAPIQMVFYTKFVFSALTGMPIKWKGQRRGDDCPGWKELILTHGLHTIVATSIGAVLFFFAPSSLPWISPVLAGLILALPFARFTGSRSIGELSRKAGLFLIEEELQPPFELRNLGQPSLDRTNFFLRESGYSEHMGVLQAVLDPYIHAIHVSFLRLREQTVPRTRNFKDELCMKLLTDGPGSLSSDERTALLWDAEAMMEAHKTLWVCAQDKLDGFWAQALRHYNESMAISIRRSIHTMPSSTPDDFRAPQ
jgi:membrane glycosyltransferase